MCSAVEYGFPEQGTGPLTGPLTTGVHNECTMRRAWDELPSTAMRKLLSRIDHQEYTAALEEMLVASKVVDGCAPLQATPYTHIACILQGGGRSIYELRCGAFPVLARQL